MYGVHYNEVKLTNCIFIKLPRSAPGYHPGHSRPLPGPEHGRAAAGPQPDEGQQGLQRVPEGRGHLQDGQEVPHDQDLPRRAGLVLARQVKVIIGNSIGNSILHKFDCYFKTACTFRESESAWFIWYVAILTRAG